MMINVNRSLIALVFLILTSSIIASELVDDAWDAWMENDQVLVEKHFISALNEDANNIRAIVGLALLYEMQRKYEKSWQIYRSLINTTDNYYPYIYAAWLMPLLRQTEDNPDLGVVELLENLTVDADAGGVLKAMANERLGNYYQEHGDIEKAKTHFKKIQAIDEWMVIGPFDNISASGFDNEYPPEEEFNTSKTYIGKNGVSTSWFEVTKIRNDFWIDFLRYFAYDESIFYANTFIYSPMKQRVQIRIGTSGSLKCFLNDDKICEYFDENNNDLDTYIVETDLQQGWNRLLIKCGFSEISRCNFLARITDVGGNAIDNISINIKKQEYISHPEAPFQSIENFSEVYFKNLIKMQPEHLENYILLAQSYLRNDKAIEAELVLREAIELAPNCALFHYHIIEAYIRGEKDDEVTTTIEKVYKLDDKVPRILGYKLDEYLDNEDFHTADRILERINILLPESEYYYEHLVNYYLTKKEYEKLQEINNSAYKKYPDNWNFVYYKSILSIRLLRSYEQAISTLEKYLQNRHEISPLSTLADIYLQSSDISGWEKTYQRIFEFDPAAVGYYYQVANDYYKQREFDKAKQKINQAIEICPNSSGYWALLGDIYRARGEISLAQEQYRTSLSYNRADYDTREKLRELKGKPPIFDRFDKTVLDTLLENAPDKELYPGVKALVLLRKANRVVYPEGASESMEELLVKVFNKRGIDDFKEFMISHNRYTEGLTIEKAVVIKSDQSEVKADTRRNQVVFKSLEENDFVYLRWRIKNYYNGKLSEHFWDKFYFNSVYPMEQVEYALLIPKDFQFEYSTHNMNLRPDTKYTEDGLLYTWKSKDVSSIGFEFGMPGMDDIGQVLYISSIEDWSYLVDWYTDLAKTKTRSSYEIKETVEALLEGRENLSQEDKIKIIYDFITENIRYSHVPFRQSGLIPQKARDVLVTRIGDCKDTATLCIAMLKEADIEANYILVNTRNEGLNKNALPSISFNHCIASVETEAGPLYLDLTANNFPIGSVPDFDINAFSLKIKKGVESPDYIEKKHFTPRNVTYLSTIEVTDDNTIEIKTSEQCTGSISAIIRNRYRQKSDYEREVIMTEILSKQFSNIELQYLDFDNLDENSSSISYSYQYEVPNFLSSAGTFKILPIPWRDKFLPEKALSYEERLYPYNYWPREDNIIQEIEIVLPDEYEPVEVPKNQNFSNEIANYLTTFSYDGEIIKARRELKNNRLQVDADSYEEFKELYNAIVQEDARQILLKKK